MQEEIRKTVGDIKEVIAERFYSPMYFYFIIAWVITNWKFVYVLLFANQDIIFSEEGVSKISFLSQLYSFDGLFNIFISLLHLVIIPAIFSFVAVWFFSSLSEKFFRKYETHKQNKRVIQGELEYREKIRFANMGGEIRDIEYNKKDIKYEDNKEFNEDLDGRQDFIIVNGIMMKPSEVLYNNDYEAYKEALREWRENSSVDNLTDEQKNQVIKEYGEDLKSEQQYNDWKDSR